MRRVALAGLLLCRLAACAQPRAGVAIDAGSGRVSVSPSISGSIGGLSVSVHG
jgi:hypothetical protein